MPPTLDDFYHLSRLVLIKDETLYDRFDLAFGEFYQPQLEALAKDKTLPEDWLRKTLTRHLSPEQKPLWKSMAWTNCWRCSRNV